MMLPQASALLSRWSQHPAGAHLLFWFAVAESCVMPLPADPLLLALCAGAPQRSLRFALICGTGSVLGGLVGYTIGHFAFDSVGRVLLQTYDSHQEVFQRVADIYEYSGFWVVLMAAVTPIPNKLFTLASGVFDFDLGQFMLASAIGRNARFLLVGGIMAGGRSPPHLSCIFIPTHCLGIFSNAAGRSFRPGTPLADNTQIGY